MTFEKTDEEKHDTELQEDVEFIKVQAEAAARKDWLKWVV